MHRHWQPEAQVVQSMNFFFHYHTPSKTRLLFLPAALALLSQQDLKISHENTADVLLCGNSQRSVAQLLYQSSILWLVKPICCDCDGARRCSSRLIVSITSECHKPKCVGRLTKETRWLLESSICICTICLGQSLLKNCQHSKQAVHMFAIAQMLLIVPFWRCILLYIKMSSFFKTELETAVMLPILYNDPYHYFAKSTQF